jgi:HPr kinase/phosphorylase
MRSTASSPKRTSTTSYPRGIMVQGKPVHISLHGVLLDVLGVGVLILGKSGIGKTECALDLVMHGHRLVADDLIQIEQGPDSSLSGFSHEQGRHHMEIRGLGIIDIEKLFGISATSEKKPIDLVIELVGPDESIIDRVGLETETYTIMGQEIPRKRIPVRPGRNLTAIVEVAARDYLLKKRGYHAAREFERKLLKSLKKRG